MFETTTKFNQFLNQSHFKLVSKFGSWLDRKMYLPYKGYNRLRSKKWNLEHTMQ